MARLVTSEYDHRDFATRVDAVFAGVDADMEEIPEWWKCTR